MVTLLLEGAPVARTRAELQLGHRLTGWHTAALEALRWRGAPP